MICRIYRRRAIRSCKHFSRKNYLSNRKMVESQTREDVIEPCIRMGCWIGITWSISYFKFELADWREDINVSIKTAQQLINANLYRKVLYILLFVQYIVHTKIYKRAYEYIYHKQNNEIVKIKMLVRIFFHTLLFLSNISAHHPNQVSIR